MRINVFIISAALVYGSSLVLAAPLALDSELAVREIYETDDLFVRDYEELEARQDAPVCSVIKTN